MKRRFMKNYWLEDKTKCEWDFAIGYGEGIAAKYRRKFQEADAINKGGRFYPSIEFMEKVISCFNSDPIPELNCTVHISCPPFEHVDHVISVAHDGWELDL